MTIPLDILERALTATQKAARDADLCGAEAIGFLRAMDDGGLIPEPLRDQVLDLLTRWRKAVDEAKAAMRLQC